MGVLHEIAPNQPLTIAKAGRRNAVGQKQQPGVFDPAGGQDKGLGADGEAAAIDALNCHAGRTGRVVGGPDLRGVGVQDAGHIAGAPDFLGIVPAKPCRRAERKDRRLKSASLHGQFRHVFAAGAAGAGEIAGRTVLGIGDLAERAGLGIVPSQIVILERPAAVRDPRPGLQIYGIERTAPSAPGVRAAAKVTKTANVQGVIVESDVAPLIEGLRGLIECKPAALKQANLNAAADEGARKCYAGGAPAYDAEVGVNNRVVVDGAPVQKHPAAQFSPEI